jgi:spermidine synthase
LGEDDAGASAEVDAGAQVREGARVEAEEAPGLDPEARRRVRILLGSILLVALCSITYELVIGTVSSYLLGDSVYQFSLTIGLYMSAMGLGSYLSRFIEEDLLRAFFWVELGVGILGGVSSALLFGVFAYTPYFGPTMWAVTIAIGTLVGLEIPLLTRYVRRYADLRVALANVLSWDYVGSLAGSLAFPLLLLPVLGLLNSAAVVGMINVLVTIGGMILFRKELGRPGALGVAALGSMALLVALFFGSNEYERFLDKRLFQDPVLYTEQTTYQKLTLTAWQGRDFRLFINGNIQFSSVDEYRYHEALVYPPMAAARARTDVLILGGGDGLAVRQVQKFEGVETITMVDLDPRMTVLASEHPLMKRLNEGAMGDDRLTVVNADAMSFLKDSRRAWDVILIDLPDPNNEALSKLYTVEFYRLVRHHLKPGGAMVTQSSAVYFAPNSFWSIHKTIEKEFCAEDGCGPGRQRVTPYHVWVPTFGDWGFNLATREPHDPSTWNIQPGGAFLNPGTMQAALHFTPDVLERDVAINRMIEPVLLRYYIDDWRRFNN